MATVQSASIAAGRETAASFRPLPGDHRFYNTMAIVMAAAILAGFSNTYLPKVVSGAPALPIIIHLHAVVFTLWLALFVVQTNLVLTNRTPVHRRLGVAGVVLAALMVVLGTATAIAVARLDHRGIPGVEFPDAEGFLLLNLGTTMVFGILVGAAWYFRRSPQTHKRLMLMATAGALIGPGVSRLPVASGNSSLIAALVMAFLFAGPAYDLVTRRRVHPAYLWSVLLAFTAVPPVVSAMSATAAWRSIAGWLLHG